MPDLLCDRLRYLVLYHLSRTNNLPALAAAAVGGGVRTRALRDRDADRGSIRTFTLAGGAHEGTQSTFIRGARSSIRKAKPSGKRSSARVSPGVQIGARRQELRDRARRDRRASRRSKTLRVDVREAARQHRGGGLPVRAPGRRPAMRCGVVVFPGMQLRPRRLPRAQARAGAGDTCSSGTKTTSLKGCDLVVLPGGWSYGDYLRGGALAAISPVMGAVREHAEKGGLVLGICNGFQVLLRGAVSCPAPCGAIATAASSAATSSARRAQRPAVHREATARARSCACRSRTARATTRTPRRISTGSRRQNRVVVPLRLAGGRRRRRLECERLGSRHRGVLNERGNVLGLMPHPERCAEEVLGNTDGLALFSAAVSVAVLTAARPPVAARPLKPKVVRRPAVRR